MNKHKISTPADIILLRKMMRECGLDYFMLEKEHQSSPVYFSAEGNRETLLEACAALENLGFSAGGVQLVNESGTHYFTVNVRCKTVFTGPHELTASLFED